MNKVIKNIPKPGRERDKLIADLKGVIACDKWQYYHASELIKGKCGHDNCVPIDSWPPPYSTDLNYAYKLWGEACEVHSLGLMYIQTGDRHEIEPDMSMEVHVKGISFADVASHVWIKIYKQRKFKWQKIQ